MFLKSEKT